MYSFLDPALYTLQPSLLLFETPSISLQFTYDINNFRFLSYTNSKDVKTKLAFTIVTHDQLGLFEILLHTIFRPYNAYCIYVGSNTAKHRHSIEKLVKCYNYLYPESNVFMAVNTTSVQWANWSVIEADLICMEQLLNLKSQ